MQSLFRHTQLWQPCLHHLTSAAAAALLLQVRARTYNATRMLKTCVKAAVLLQLRGRIYNNTRMLKTAGRLGWVGLG